VSSTKKKTRRKPGSKPGTSGNPSTQWRPGDRPSPATEFKPGSSGSPSTQFKPETSGNPAGYFARGRRVSEELAKIIHERGGDRALAMVWLREALDGNYKFFQLLIKHYELPVDIVMAALGSAANPIDVAVDVPKRIAIPDVDERLNRDD
jgi:hypothetical protein